MLKNSDTLKRNLIHDLEHISTLLIGPFTLSAEATKWGTEWYENLYHQNKDSYANDRYAGYTARKQTHMHKLAMILSAAESDKLTIERHHLQEAEKHLLDSERQMHQVFDRIVSIEARPANLIVDSMRKNKKMNRRDLYLSLFQQMSKEQFLQGLEAGISAGLIELTSDGDERFITYKGDLSNGSAKVS